MLLLAPYREVMGRRTLRCMLLTGVEIDLSGHHNRGRCSAYGENTPVIDTWKDLDLGGRGTEVA